MRNLKTTAKPPRTATPRPRRTLRLPGTIVAKTIELHLELDPRSRSFRGQARYALEVAEATNSIELHSAELAVRDVECVVGGCGIASEPIKGRVEAHPECETILLRFDRALDPGSLSLSLRFRGRVRGRPSRLVPRERSQDAMARKSAVSDGRAAPLSLLR